MPRYKLTLEYDGTGFVGWQRQTTGLGVQQVLEEAAEKFCGQVVTAFAAGRTDSGVHATGQVAHIELAEARPVDKSLKGLNFHMKPPPAVVVKAEEAADDFHARFSAVERSYVYRLVNRSAPLTYLKGYRWWVPQPLDAAAMHDAAQVLVGHHDFTTFRATMCQAKSPQKTLDQLDVTVSDGDGEGTEIIFSVRAPSFLHHQVRNMVGTLRLVGEGKWSADDVRAALQAKDRRAGGPTAPPDGLFLTGVRYG